LLMSDTETEKSLNTLTTTNTSYLNISDSKLLTKLTNKTVGTVGTKKPPFVLVLNVG
jgi:hypothetical protein